MRDTVKELAVTGLLAAIAVTALVSLYTTERPVMSFQYASGLSFNTLPGLYAGLLLFLCLISAASTLFSRKRAAMPPADKKSLIRAAATIVLLLCFVALLGKVFFALLCAGFLCLLFVVYGKRNIVQIAGICLAGAAGLHLIFVTALGLRL